MEENKDFVTEEGSYSVANYSSYYVVKSSEDSGAGSIIPPSGDGNDPYDPPETTDPDLITPEWGEAEDPEPSTPEVPKTTEPSGPTEEEIKAASNTMETATLIPCFSTSYGGTIQVTGAKRWYRFVADERMAHKTTSSSGTYTVFTMGALNTVGSLYDSAGNLLSSRDGGGSGQNFSISANLSYGQTYYICVSSNDGTGYFAIRINYTAVFVDTSNDKSTATSLGFNSPSYGELCCPGADYWYTFVANASKAHWKGSKGTYTIRSTGALNTMAYLYDDSNRMVANNSGMPNFSITAQLDEGKRYYVRVVSDDIGTFTVTASYTIKDNSNTLDSAENLPLKTDVSGEIRIAGGCYWYKFVANGENAHWNGSDGTYTVYTAGGLNTIGYLYDDCGTQIGYNDNGGTVNNFSITTQLVAGKTYYVKVIASSSSIGTFFIRVNYKTNDGTNTKEEAVSINVGQTISGNILRECGEFWYKFKANAADAHINGGLGRYTISTSGSLDTTGYLYNSAGNQIDYDDNDGSGTNFSITAELAYNEWYYVRVKPYGYNTGSYNLNVKHIVKDNTNSMDTAEFLPFRSTTAGSIRVECGEYWYKFKADAEYAHVNGSKGKYTIRTMGSMDTTGSLYDTSGNRIVYNDDANSSLNFSITAELAYGNWYYVRVKPYNASQTGNYTIYLDYTVNDGSNTRATAEKLPFNTSVTGYLPCPQTEYWYKFTANAQAAHDDFSLGTYAIYTEGPTPTVGYLFDANGSFVAFDDGKDSADANFRIETSLACGQVYFICVKPFLDETGEYSIRVEYKTVVQGNESTKVEASEDEAKDSTNLGSAMDPVDVYSGAHTLQNTLLSLADGQKLSVVAKYNSTKLVNGSLGIGWYHNFDKHIEFCDNEALVYTGAPIYDRYVSIDGGTTYTCVSPGKRGYKLAVNHAGTYPFHVNCNQEKDEYYDSDGRLVLIKTHQGFETTITYADGLITVTDGVTGKSMFLQKDTAGRVVRIYDSANRNATLTYSGDLLVKITDVNGNSLSFTYDSVGRVLTGTDDTGVCYFTNTYDIKGRVCEQRDGVGSSPTLLTYVYDGTRILTDRNGAKITRVFNSDGLLTRYTDGNGNMKTYTYDEYCNIIKETDENGNFVLTEYNEFNKPAVITDKNGNVTRYTYDDRANLIRVLYASGVEETFHYNEKNQIICHKDQRGTVITYAYDASGMPAAKKIGDRTAIQYVYENGLLMRETDAMGNTVTYEYNTIGQAIAKTDAAGNRTTFEYDLSGHLLKATDAKGNSVSYTYDENYQKTSHTDANGNRTLYTYNGNMKPVTVTSPDGNTVTYEYDGEDRPTRVIDPNCYVSVTSYDNGGRVVSRQDADGFVTRFTYDKAGNVTREQNAKNAYTHRTYDKAGNVLSVKDYSGNTTSFFYDSMSRLVRKVDALSGVTRYEYSAAGDLLCETNAQGGTVSFTYDAFGNRLTQRDAMGNVTSYTYDDNNNMTSMTDALGNVTVYTYDCRNLLICATDAKGASVHYDYDALGRRIAVTDAKGNVTRTAYDANGNVISVTDAKGNVIQQTEYNELNLAKTVTDASGNTVTYSYNNMGKLSTSTDAFGNTKRYYYNARGMNISVTDENGKTSRITVDALGKVTAVTGPLGGSTRYTYDTMGRVLNETTSSGYRVTYTYNALNLKASLTNGRGQKATYTYDSLGRITGITRVEDTVSYTYDKNGNILTVTDKNGTVTRTFDALNRVTKMTDTEGNTVEYRYDAVGNLVRLIYPDGSAVVYTYDVNRNLVSVTDWAGRSTVYTYDVNNKVTGVIKPDGSVTATVYDNAQRVVSTVEKTASGQIITGFEYTYDDLGRIICEKHLAKNEILWYTYDKLSRVITKRTQNTVTGSETVANFSYDAAGNLLTDDSMGQEFVYDTNNRLISTCECVNVTYDADGNMTYTLLDGELTYLEYDSTNKLISAGNCQYTYNGENVRIRNLCGESETKYVYDTNARLSRLLQKTTDGAITKYVYGKGLIGEESENSFKTYHYDYRGSTVAITDMNGNVTDTFAYDTYGKLLSRTGTSKVIFGYNGRDGVVTDANGLLYMRARYYCPELRRFVNSDVIVGEISNAVTLNRYAYANGNPVSNIDPFGLSAERGFNFIYSVGASCARGYGVYSDISDIAEMYEFWQDCSKYNFYTKKAGDYIHIKGARSPVALDNGIKGTRYAVKNADSYWDVFKNINVKAGLKSEFLLKTPSGKINGGAILNYVGVGVDVVGGVFENLEEGTKAQRIVSDAVVDAGVGLGTIAVSTMIGSAVGSIIPVAGNIVGAAVGMAAGYVIDWALNADFIGDQSLVDLAKDYAGIVADNLAETINNASDWISDSLSSVGGFLAGVFS